MASAIFTSRNDPRSSHFMSNFTNSGNLSFVKLQNIPNPNPRPNPTNFFVGNNRRNVLSRNHRQLPSSASPQAKFIGSSINAVPANSCGYRYITFRLGSYSKIELKELKRRLMVDLERVRILRQWVCEESLPKTNYHPQLLELPAPPEVYMTENRTRKSAVGQKRTNPLPPVRDSKKQCGRVTNAQKRKMMMRECGQILGKLMKHKHGWVFNTPVDVAGMKLYDYHSIINSPMDLGTIKSKLAKDEYESPLAFASDVRLTFQNAIVYNGKGSNVSIMAECLLLLFEDLFDKTQKKFVVNQVKRQNLSASVPIPAEKPASNAIIVVEPPQANPVNVLSPIANASTKPKMTDEEKSELAASFWNLQLGPEGLDQIMAIVREGVSGLEHQGDEIELDLALLDNDTLWGLQSFIDSIRKKLITNLIPSSPVNEHLKEDDIDIGEEEMQLAIIPFEIEKDAVNGSSNESSSGSDSSSTDSGSGTCSGNSYNEQEVNSAPEMDP